MADAPEGKPDSEGEPNLELPSLSLALRRRKKKQSKPVGTEQAAPDSVGSTADAVASQEMEEPSAVPSGAHRAVPEAAPATEPAPEPAPEPVERATREDDPRASAADAAPTGRAVPPPPPGSLAVPPPPPTAASDRIPPPPVAASAAEEPAAAVPAALEPSASQADDELADDELADQEPGDAGSPGDAAPPRKGRPQFRAPVLSGKIAAPLTGAVCGLVAVGLAALSSEGCASVRGVGGCGTFGFFALVAILAIAVILGSLLLKLCRVADPTSTSFLGSGIVAVLVMLFLLDAIGSIWMVLVIPVLGAAAFWLSWWVTATFVEESSG